MSGDNHGFTNALGSHLGYARRSRNPPMAGLVRISVSNRQRHSAGDL